MFEDVSIPIDKVRVSLPSGTLGVFEPVSCMMFFNLTDDEFDVWRAEGDPADMVGLTVAHEWYHYLQTIGTGFMYDQCQRQLWALRNSKVPLPLMGQAIRVYTRRIKRAPIQRVRYFRASPYERAHVAFRNRYWDAVLKHSGIEQLAARYGVRMLGGLLHPSLAADVEKLREPMRARGSSGLSAQDIFEGSAVVYALSTGRGETGADCSLRQRELSEDSPYERLAKLALARCVDRPVTVPLLAAAALALRFEQPGEAFFPLLDSLLKEPPGTELHVARNLDLTSIVGAGAVLGTALEAHRAEIGKKRRCRYSNVEWYTTALDRLASGQWKVDEMLLLTAPDALGRIPGGQFTFGFVFRDGARAPTGVTHVGFRRMLGAIMLRSGQSVIGARKELADYFHEHRDKLVP